MAGKQKWIILFIIFICSKPLILSVSAENKNTSFLMESSTGSSTIDNYWKQQYLDLHQQIKDKKPLAKRTVENSDAYDINAHVLPTDNTPVDIILRRTMLLLQDLERLKKSSKIKEFEKTLKNLESEYTNQPLAKSTVSRGSEELFVKISALHRQAALDNPLLDFDDLLFIGYVFPNNEVHMCDQYNPWNINMGGGLYILKDFKTNPVLVDVLQNSQVENGPFKGSDLFGGAFLSPDLSFDGKTILFAWSPSTDRCYHIFRVNIDGSGLRQLTFGSSSEFNFLTNSNHNDFDPVWLPNGRIVFISDRRGGYGRCHTKGKPTFTLHSMKDDGSDIICLSYHETNEWHPSVDNDGKILYTRWDYIDRDDCIAHHLWSCYPDGRDPRSYHGNYPLPLETFTGSNWRDGRWDRPVAEYNIRAIPNSQKYIATASGHHSYTFGELIFIDPTIEDDGKVSQVERITTAWNGWPDFQTGPYGTAWPLSEDYYICNKENTIILRDRFGGEELIFASNSWRPIDPIPVKARQKPPALATATWQGERENRPDHYRATIKVNDVNICDLPLPEDRPIKSMRIVQVFPKETRLINDPRNGYPSEALARMSLGTVPVESDGSVYCEAPVGKIIYFQLLDEEGLAVQSMRTATYVHPGEQMACVGCHENKWKAPPGGANKIAFMRSPSKLTPEAGGVEPVNFARLVKPVFDNKCASCHRNRGRGPSMSYRSLKDYAFYFCGNGNPYINGDIVTPKKGGSRTIPGMFGASYSELIKYLDPSHHDVNLTSDEYRRITLWLDLNSMELGADYDVESQRNGELVWPRMDVDPLNPQGIEKDYPLTGTVNIINNENSKYRIIRNGLSVSLINTDESIVEASLFNISGRLIKKWNFNQKVKSVRFDLNSTPITKGVYIFTTVNTRKGEPGSRNSSSMKFIFQ